MNHQEDTGKGQARKRWMMQIIAVTGLVVAFATLETETATYAVNAGVLLVMLSD